MLLIGNHPPAVLRRPHAHRRGDGARPTLVFSHVCFPYCWRLLALLLPLLMSVPAGSAAQSVTSGICVLCLASFAVQCIPWVPHNTVNNTLSLLTLPSRRQSGWPPLPPPLSAAICCTCPTGRMHCCTAAQSCRSYRSAGAQLPGPSRYIRARPGNPADQPCTPCTLLMRPAAGTPPNLRTQLCTATTWCAPTACVCSQQSAFPQTATEQHQSHPCGTQPSTAGKRRLTLKFAIRKLWQFQFKVARALRPARLICALRVCTSTIMQTAAQPNPDSVMQS